MTKRLSPYRLGATLYMPATRNDIAGSILNNQIDGLRSIVICLEDAVSDADVPAALQNLRQILVALKSAKDAGLGADWPLVFIRPRDPEMGKFLTETEDLTPADGLVLPKFTLESFSRGRYSLPCAATASKNSLMREVCSFFMPCPPYRSRQWDRRLPYQSL